MLKYELRLEIERSIYMLIRSNSFDRVLSKLIGVIKNEWPGIHVNTSTIWYDASITLFCKYEDENKEIYIEFDCFSDTTLNEFRDRLIDGINN